MAAGLLALARGGMLIENPGCVAKSYPGFFRDLAGSRPVSTPPSPGSPLRGRDEGPEVPPVTGEGRGEALSPSPVTGEVGVTGLATI